MITCTTVSRKLDEKVAARGSWCQIGGGSNVTSVGRAGGGWKGGGGGGGGGALYFREKTTRFKKSAVATFCRVPVSVKEKEEQQQDVR